MINADELLSNLSQLFGDSFKDAIVWEQRDQELLGKYVYLKYAGKDLGMFMGYYLTQSNSVRACITFFFAHPSSPIEDQADVTRMFHKLLIRLNLRLKHFPYKRVDGKSSAVMRTMYFKKDDFTAEASNQFFKESIDVIIKNCEPLYKAVSS